MQHDTNLAQQLFTSHIMATDMNNESISKAKEIFETYKKDAVILSGEFEHRKWKCSNEYEHLHFDFDIDSFQYRRFYEKIFGIDCGMFTVYLKTFILMHLGTLQLHTLQDIIRNVKYVVGEDPEEIYALNNEIRFYHPLYISEFFQLLPEPADEEGYNLLIEAMDKIAENTQCSSGDQRTLASFDTYMTFNEIMNDYWKSDISDEDRMFYFPLYLWWQITSVYPQRPREFLLMPRDCLVSKQDGYYLTMRKNMIKGSDTEKTYKIPSDYVEVRVMIPDKLAKEILKYQEFTKKYPSNELDTFLVSNPHYQKWNIQNRPSSRYFTYTNLRTVLHYFYTEIIFGRYNMKLQPDLDVSYLRDDEIQMLHLGDTRHLSLINIIAEGGTPVIAAMLAGHRSMDMASHYYSNITKFIECRTYRQYKKTLRGEVKYALSHKESLPPTARSYVTLPDGNRCYSTNYRNAIFTDCRKAVGENGEIGSCSDCSFHRKSSAENFLSDDSGYKNKLKLDCEHLERVVRAVRTMNGDTEDLMQAFLRIRSSSYEYGQFLKEKMENESQNKEEQ